MGIRAQPPSQAEVGPAFLRTFHPYLEQAETHAAVPDKEGPTGTSRPPQLQEAQAPRGSDISPTLRDEASPHAEPFLRSRLPQHTPGEGLSLIHI